VAFVLGQTAIQNIALAGLDLLQAIDPDHVCSDQDTFGQGIGHPGMEEDIDDMAFFRRGHERCSDRCLLNNDIRKQLLIELREL
jgi:hypothetical protein